MATWKKIYAATIVLMGIAMFNPYDAQAESKNACAPLSSDACDECDCCLDWGVDFLLWKPAVDDLDYAVKVSTDIDGELKFKYRDVSHDWEPGFRIRALKPDLCSCWGLGASYTYIYATDKVKTNSENNEQVFTLLLHPDIHDSDHPWEVIRAKYHLRYQAWDVLLSRPFGWGCCHIFTPFFGIGGVILDQDYTSRMQKAADVFDITEGIKGRAKWNSDFFGAGLKFGSELLYQMYECFAVYAKGSCEILAGSACTEYRHKYQFDAFESTLEEQDWKFKDSRNCHFVNGYHIQFGGAYDWNCCGCDMALKFGYEFVKYHNVPTPRRYFVRNSSTNLRSRSTSSDLTTLGFHGLFLGLDFLY